MEYSRSTFMASQASWAFLDRVRWEVAVEKQVSLTSCWVMVEPPAAMPWLLTLVKREPTILIGSRPTFSS